MYVWQDNRHVEEYWNQSSLSLLSQLFIPAFIWLILILHCSNLQLFIFQRDWPLSLTPKLGHHLQCRSRKVMEIKQIIFLTNISLIPQLSWKTNGNFYVWKYWSSLQNMQVAQKFSQLFHQLHTQSNQMFHLLSLTNKQH